jgi:hypothetical protein
MQGRLENSARAGPHRLTQDWPRQRRISYVDLSRGTKTIVTDISPTAIPSRSTLPMSTLAGSQWTKYLYWLGRLLNSLTFGHGKLYIYLFCAQPIGAGTFDAVRDSADTVVQPVPLGNSLIAHFPRPSEIIAQRFARGSVCYAAIVKREFAGHIWLASDFYDEDEVRCRYALPSDQQSVWDYDVYIEPRHRLGRALGRLWKGVDAALSGQGVRWSVSRISLFNATSIQTHERLGAIHLATGVFVILGPMQLALFSKVPYIHFGMCATQRPALALQPPMVFRATDPD